MVLTQGQEALKNTSLFMGLWWKTHRGLDSRVVNNWHGVKSYSGPTLHIFKIRFEWIDNFPSNFT